MHIPVNLNTVNLHWKIKPGPFYKIVKRVYPKTEQLKDFKCYVMFSFPYVNTPTWADVLFEKLKAETWG